MRKALLSPMLAVALMAVLAAVIPVSQVHAAPNITNCTATHWEIYAEAIGGDSGYIFDMQVYELRDAANNYCGKVYSRVGITVPAHAGPDFRFYDDNYQYGGLGFVNQTTTYHLNNYPCCENGPYWVGNSGDQWSYSLGHGHWVEVEGMAAPPCACNFKAVSGQLFL
jgi:hypothetical protein